MFLPIVIGINNLYPWAHAATVAADPLLQHKAPYLNVPFFLGRAAFYFAGWMFLSWWFNRWSAQGRSRRPRRGPRQDERHGRPGPAVLGIQRHLHGRSTGFCRWIPSGSPPSSACSSWPARADRDGLPDHADGPAVPAAADVGSADPPPPARSRQVPARAGDGVGVLFVLAVPDHLGGQSAGRNSLVSDAPESRLAVCRTAAGGRAISRCPSRCCSRAI